MNETKTKPSHRIFKLIDHAFCCSNWLINRNGIIKAWLHCLTSDRQKEDFLSIVY